MSLPPIHQWIAGASTGDAVTTDAFALQGILRSWGHPSEVFADYRHVSVDMRGACRDLRSFPDDLPPGSAVLYHFSIGSGLTERFLALPPGVRRLGRYHNITPARYFRVIRPATARVLEEGRRDLARVAPQIEIGLGDSSYNCREIEEAGCRRTAVVPLTWRRPPLEAAPDPAVLGAYGDGAVNWLFVGRVAPNKKIEDVIRAFYWARRLIRPHARLFVVGSTAGTGRYFAACRALAAQLDLPGVIFTDHVNAHQLVAYYRLADVFVCMSEHEGFCLPLLEAMSFDVPVVAYAAAAVPETLGDGGILLQEKDYPLAAEVADRAATDPGVRAGLVRAGRRRLEAFSPAAVERALRDALRQAD